MLVLNEVVKNLINLPRYAKITTAILLDIGLCIFCTWIAFYLRLEEFIRINNVALFTALISIAFAIPIFWLLGIYRSFFRFLHSAIFFLLAIAILVYGILYFSVIGIYGIPGIPRSIGIIQPLLLFLTILSSRLIIKYFLGANYSSQNRSQKKKNILIYGAGGKGRQLLTSLENNLEMRVIGFLDDDKKLQQQIMLGQTIYSPLKIEHLIKSKKVDLVLLALPTINRTLRNEIINNLNKYQITVKTLPSLQDIVDGKITVSDIKDLTIDDLLSREEVQPNYQLLSKNINSKIVMVTGAGGSIGSELCIQIIKLNPKKLVLIELNEFALYKINEKLKNLNLNVEIVPLLINIQNKDSINEILKTFKINTIYHTAAFKHVPLVEENICEGVKNNVFGTYNIAQTSIQNDVSNFVLISSDKAVRPTNIMGATKRLSEICVQSLYNENKTSNTKFSIVRFGNVLQSSGSVIPKFKKQIKEGGPVTLTHPEVTRYFMTKTEASQLVIQAGAMSDGCQVFILDMGKSIKIMDLIYRMIKLSGLTIKDDKNPNGDIEIKITNLRPGEKLYEELLLGENPQKTYHEKIQKAQDPFIPFSQLQLHLDNLNILLNNNKVAEVKSLLENLIPLFKSNSKIVDHMYQERLNLSYGRKLSDYTKDQKNKVIRIKT